ncbi:uncharacterized protein LOC129981571 [Argiope bruennichi]|uniref:uncharacterized protein LOC129981571 n=1 Tax=Argiope bruennichi TaxID=94029 RepID=UPI002494C473|nr:uncharacterized protein LOC129981571 [Argiope bruennichi]
MDTYDLCIIGAGMFGSSAARHASANPCLKVCLIGPEEPKIEEYNSREIFSSYYDEGRVVLVAERDPAIQVLSKHSINRFRETEKLSGIKFYHPVGTLLAGEKGSPLLLSWLGELKMNRVPFIDLSQAESLNKRYPFLRLEECFHPFLDNSGAGHISPRNLVEAQKKLAKMQGCHLINEVVQEVSENDSGEHKILTESGRIIRAKRVLFCTGAFTKFKKLGLPQHLKIAVHKETAALLEVPDDERERLSSMPTIMMYKKEIEDMPPSTTGTYILPPILYPDGKYYLKIGPMGHQRNSELTTLQEAKEWYSDPGDSEVMEKMSRLIFKIIPNLKVTDVRSKTCITCDSPPHLPYIDRITPTVTIAVVGNGLGATTCDEIGRIASELSVTGKWDSELPKSLFEAIYDQ